MPAEGRKISQLTPASSIADTDLIPKENAAGTSTEAATAAQLANYFKSKGVQVDNTLSTPGAAADAAKTGAEVTDLKNAITGIEVEGTQSTQFVYFNDISILKDSRFTLQFRISSGSSWNLVVYANTTADENVIGHCSNDGVTSFTAPKDINRLICYCMAYNSAVFSVMHLSITGIGDLQVEVENQENKISIIENSAFSDGVDASKWFQGYWAIANGNKSTGAATWIATSDFLDNTIAEVYNKSNLLLYIQAWDKTSGSYIGTWNGSQWSTTYTSGTGLLDVNFADFRSSYPNYNFRITVTATDSSDITPTTNGAQIHFVSSKIAANEGNISKAQDELDIVIDGISVDGTRSGDSAFVYFNNVGIPSGLDFDVTFNMTSGSAASVIVYKNTTNEADLLGYCSVNGFITFTATEDINRVICYISGNESAVFDVMRISSVGLTELKRIVNPLVPDSQWNTAIDTLRAQQGDSLCFGIQTDSHFTDRDSDYIGTQLKNSTKDVGFDFVANLGDITRGYYDSRSDMQTYAKVIMKRYTDGVCCPFLVTVGNHESNLVWNGEHPEDVIFTRTELYAQYIRQVKNTSSRIVGIPGKNYYYLDLPNARVICLYTNDASNGGFAISQDQITWFTNTALNTPKPVLILSHVPLVSGWDPATNYSADYAYIVSALEAFKNNGGVVIACVCGHTHYQASQKINGIWYIVCTKTESYPTTAEFFMVDMITYNITTIGVGNAQSRTFTH